MSILSSGLWCDICRKPILDGDYWECTVNGKRGHGCKKCKDEIEAGPKIPIAEILDKMEGHSLAAHHGRALSQTGYVKDCMRCRVLQGKHWAIKWAVKTFLMPVATPTAPKRDDGRGDE